MGAAGKGQRQPLGEPLADRGTEPFQDGVEERPVDSRNDSGSDVLRQTGTGEQVIGSGHRDPILDGRRSRVRSALA